MDLVQLFAYVSKWANPHFAWVSPLVNSKKRLFSNKHKKVIANNGTNKGASEMKLCSHVGETPFFIPMTVSRIFPQKWVSPLGPNRLYTLKIILNVNTQFWKKNILQSSTLTHLCCFKSQEFNFLLLI